MQRDTRSGFLDVAYVLRRLNSSVRVSDLYRPGSLKLKEAEGMQSMNRRVCDLMKS